jgi:hypothetical protein
MAQTPNRNCRGRNSMVELLRKGKAVDGC